jgi:pimeloyl-ACP methyl ester carboxylesterase
MAVEGGPGYGSIGSANTYSHLFGRLLRDRDLVMVDMRGTDGSGAIDCRDLQTGKGPQLLDLATCARQLGPDTDSYRTAAAADDLDDVRRALGYERVSMYGDSYGTFLAQSYAFRHPDALDALVLESAYPVRGESPWYPSVWRTGVRAIATSCERDPACPPGAAERFERFVAQLRREGIGVGPLLYALGTAGYSPPRSYLRIDRVARAYLDGRRRPYERLAKRGKVSYGDPAGYSSAQELAVSCNDYPMVWNKESSYEQRQIELQEAIRRYPGEALAPFTPREIALSSDVSYVECLAWPPPGELYEPPVEESAPAPEMPVLVVAGELDNVTSPAEGRKVAEEFPNAKLFVAPGAGHVSSLYDASSPEGREIRRFLAEHG